MMWSKFTGLRFLPESLSRRVNRLAKRKSSVDYIVWLSAAATGELDGVRRSASFVSTSRRNFEQLTV